MAESRTNRPRPRPPVYYRAPRQAVARISASPHGVPSGKRAAALTTCAAAMNDATVTCSVSEVVPSSPLSELSEPRSTAASEGASVLVVYSSGGEFGVLTCERLVAAARGLATRVACSCTSCRNCCSANVAPKTLLQQNWDGHECAKRIQVYIDIM